MGLRRQESAVTDGQHRVPVLGQVQAGFMRVTPEQADYWLAFTNTRNRDLKPKHIERFARDMKNGNWRFDAMPLRFAGDFTLLLDGQNRLAAQVQTGVTLTHLVVTGLEQASQDTMDGNVPRRFVDALRIDGTPNAKNIAAVVRALYNYDTIGSAVTGGGRGSSIPSVPELQDLLERNPRIGDYLVGSFRGLSPSMLSVFYYVAATRVSEEDAGVFVEKLRTGEGLQRGNPIHTLRERLMRESADSTTSLPSVTRWSFLVRAWLAWMRGENLFRLVWRAGGADPEPPPRIEVALNTLADW